MRPPEAQRTDYRSGGKGRSRARVFTSAAEAKEAVPSGGGAGSVLSPLADEDLDGGGRDYGTAAITSRYELGMPVE